MLENYTLSFRLSLEKKAPPVRKFLPVLFMRECSLWLRSTSSNLISFAIQQFHMQVFNYIDTVLVFVIPFTTIVILNTFTALAVWKVASVRRTMTMPKRQGSNNLEATLSRITNFHNFLRKSNVRDFRKQTHVHSSKLNYSHVPTFNLHVCKKSKRVKEAFDGNEFIFNLNLHSSQKDSKLIANQGHKDAAARVIGVCVFEPS